MFLRRNPIPLLTESEREVGVERKGLKVPASKGRGWREGQKEVRWKEGEGWGRARVGWGTCSKVLRGIDAPGSLHTRTAVAR